MFKLSNAQNEGLREDQVESSVKNASYLLLYSKGKMFVFFFFSFFLHMTTNEKRNSLTVTQKEGL